MTGPPSYVRGLAAERAGYVRAGRFSRVIPVDVELARSGWCVSESGQLVRYDPKVRAVVQPVLEPRTDAVAEAGEAKRMAEAAEEAAREAAAVADKADEEPPRRRRRVRQPRERAVDALPERAVDEV